MVSERLAYFCLTNTLLFLDKVFHSVDEGHDVDIEFLDLTKTFHKVPHKDRRQTDRRICSSKYPNIT